ncbi:hypothetical protein, partial [Aneurinibacillus aneurinilyticus]|uniref:hypothetical protein n=1 Tax=Aneurinibacillus aneurinilyticus TaxID=1391 RepID=UPI002E1F3718|nr:hypothetical protein [Aneurinibacillus aneurinilyticus]
KKSGVGELAFLIAVLCIFSLPNTTIGEDVQRQETTPFSTAKKTSKHRYSYFKRSIFLSQILRRENTP